MYAKRDEEELQRSTTENRSSNKQIHTAKKSISRELSLEGEWIVCASGESRDLNGDANVSDGATKRVDGPKKSIETEDAMESQSKGCERSESEGASVGEADGDHCRR